MAVESFREGQKSAFLDKIKHKMDTNELMKKNKQLRHEQRQINEIL